MSFAMTPDDGPPRLVRFLEAAEFPSRDTVALLDPKCNLLRVNLSIYSQLSDFEKGRVLKTHAPFLEVSAR